MSFSLYKTSCLYIHPPGIAPLLHLCKLVPAAGPAQRREKEQGERRSKVLEVICRAALRQIPLDSSKKKVMWLRKAKYHTDLHWAESCVLLLGGHGQPEEAVWWEMHSRDTQKQPELCHGAPCTPQTFTNTTPCFRLSPMGHWKLLGEMRASLMGFVPSSATAGGEAAIAIKPGVKGQV